MAHEIYENDNMISVRQLPWHGLGIVLDDNPTPKEAQVLCGLTWSVRKEPVIYRMPEVNGISRTMEVPGSFVVVRNDNHMPLGVVGQTYEPYQNDAMFEFMEVFTSKSGGKIETAGSLRNGRIVWALSTAGEVEYLKNDPIKQYFLFKNSFDGSNNVEICFTDVRVVCNNTLTAALKNATNMWRIRHTGSMYSQISEVQETLFRQRKYSAELQGIMEQLISHTMTGREIEKAARELVTRQPLNLDEFMDGGSLEESTTRHERRTIDKILELHESGAGSDIPGVRGTAYGLLNACTEYADHFRTVRPGQRSYAEARFESLMMGSSQEFKERAFDYISELVV